MCPILRLLTEEGLTQKRSRLRLAVVQLRGFMRLCSVILISLVLSALPAAAGPVVTVVSDSGYVYFNGAYTLGWEFRVASPTQVTSLGFWDYLGDGFHTVTGSLTGANVAIWNTSETLLVSAIVASSDPISNVLLLLPRKQALAHHRTGHRLQFHSF